MIWRQILKSGKLTRIRDYLDENKLAESGYSDLDFTTIWWSIIDRALLKATGNK